jgi:hypothetical protein
VVHFEEQQVGKLFDIIAVGNPVVAQHVAVIPQALDDGGGFIGHWISSDYQTYTNEMYDGLISQIKLKFALSGYCAYRS